MRGRCTELNLWTIAPDHDGGKFTTRCSPILDLPRPVHPVRGFLFWCCRSRQLELQKIALVFVRGAVLAVFALHFLLRPPCVSLRDYLQG